MQQIWIVFQYIFAIQFLQLFWGELMNAARNDRCQKGLLFIFMSLFDALVLKVDQ